MRVIRDNQRPDMPRRSCVLVPTMGALHEGHLDLIRRAASEADARGLKNGAAVSVFVNPTQFNDPADYERYARVLDDDIAGCESAGASIVFAPSVELVYPTEDPTPVPPLPPQAIDKGLEDAHRPMHFEGVCQVVRRLFDLVLPAAAVFGEKDWQQLVTVRAMSQRDDLGVEIINGPTAREPDGLAMSSRNRFLPPEQRERALSLSRAIAAAQRETTPTDGEAAMRAVYAEHEIEPDYAAIRDAETLGPFRQGRPGRAITAAGIPGETTVVRLLDNAPWPIA